MNEANANNNSETINAPPSLGLGCGDYRIEIVESSNSHQPTRPYQGCWPSSLVEPIEADALPKQYGSFKEAFFIQPNKQGEEK